MRLALPDADIALFAPVHLPLDPDRLLERLIADTLWRADNITLWGRTYPQPRLTAWHGDPGAHYRYAGIALAPTPWTELLTALRAIAETHANARFNSVLLNYYRDECDSMGLHSDDEPELGLEPVIASLSLGCERALLFRHKTNRALPPTRIMLPSASLLIMRGLTQTNWKHGIEKRRTPCAPRLNLTFRRII